MIGMKPSQPIVKSIDQGSKTLDEMNKSRKPAVIFISSQRRGD